MSRRSRIRRPDHTTVVAYLSLFLVLTGGVAIAAQKLGAGSVKSKTIKDGGVKNKDLAADAVSSPKVAENSLTGQDIDESTLSGLSTSLSGQAGGDLTGSYPNPSIAANAVNGGKVAENSLTGSDIDEGTLTGLSPSALGLNFLRANTARLSDVPGGPGAGQPLFTIGRVDLNAFCAASSDGSLRGGISPNVDDAGAVLVSGDSAVGLQPFDVQFVVIANDPDANPPIDGQEASFAILDDTETSASGVAAVSADAATGRCVITAHAVG